jgi:hypothetical protein
MAMVGEFWARIDAAELRLRDMVREVSKLSGSSPLDVEDELGIGCIDMASVSMLEFAANRLQPELERLRRNNPPRIPGTAWRKFAVADPGHIVPELAACYAIFGDGRLVYVGSTENLAERMQGHGFKLARYSNTIHTAWGAFANVIIKYRASLKYGDWAMVELRLIRRLQPTGNRRGIRKVRAANRIED